MNFCTGALILDMMLAWSWGYSTPSASTVRRMVSWVTEVTCTGAGASALASSFFFEQPESSNPHAATTSNWFRCCISLKRPCQSLQSGERDSVAGQSIVVGVACLSHGILRVHEFQYRSLAGLVAQGIQAEALGGEVGGFAEQIHLFARGLRFLIEGVQVAHELALGRAQFHLGLMAPDLGLPQAALPCAPIQNRKVQRG